MILDTSLLYIQYNITFHILSHRISCGVFERAGTVQVPEWTRPVQTGSQSHNSAVSGAINHSHPPNGREASSAFWKYIMQCFCLPLLSTVKHTAVQTLNAARDQTLNAARASRSCWSSSVWTDSLLQGGDPPQHHVMSRGSHSKLMAELVKAGLWRFWSGPPGSSSDGLPPVRSNTTGSPSFP